MLQSVLAAFRSLKLIIRQHHFDIHLSDKCRSREIKLTACCCADKDSDAFGFLQPWTEL